LHAVHYDYALPSIIIVHDQQTKHGAGKWVETVYNLK